MTGTLETMGKQAKQVCRAAIGRLDTDTAVKSIGDGIRARGLNLCEPSGGERLSITQIVESPVTQTVGVVVIKSKVATPSLGGEFQSGFTLHLDKAILPLSNREAVAKVAGNSEIFGENSRISALVSAITRWPVCN